MFRSAGLRTPPPCGPVPQLELLAMPTGIANKTWQGDSLENAILLIATARIIGRCPYNPGIQSCADPRTPDRRTFRPDYRDNGGKSHILGRHILGKFFYLPSVSQYDPKNCAANSPPSYHAVFALSRIASTRSSTPFAAHSARTSGVSNLLASQCCLFDGCAVRSAI